MVDDIGDELEKIKKVERERFGPRNTLQQMLWDGQVEDTYYNETFRGIVMLMRQCCEDEEFKKQLYEINLKDWEDDDEDWI